jgi:hypothetical protein
MAPMTTYCSSYEHHAEAEETVARLLASGVDGDDVRVLMGAPDRDGDPAGGFAGSVAAAAPVGTFAGHAADRGIGGFAGDPATQRRGSFATIDRDTLTTFEDGRTRRVQGIGHRHLVSLLVDAGLDEEKAKRDVDSLHDGRALVLVRSDEAVEALL